jgi:hypothetical protein
MTQTAVLQGDSEQTSDQNVIRPFQVDIPEAELTELRKRITAGLQIAAVGFFTRGEKVRHD